MDTARTLVYRFLRLPHHERMALAQRVGLLSQAESLGDDEAEMHRLICARAREQGLEERLREEVDRAHRT